jgi:hypothetical protein
MASGFCGLVTVGVFGFSGVFFFFQCPFCLLLVLRGCLYAFHKFLYLPIK